MNTVLLIDDDVAVTNHLKVFLMQTERFEGRVINDSRQALESLEKGPADAAILDMDMPNVSGLDILKAVRERGLGIPVIVLTGVGDVELAVRAMKLGAFDYLTKPVDEETLLRVLDTAVRQRDIQRSIRSLPTDLKGEDLAHGEAFAYFPTQDPAMIRLHHEAEWLAAGDGCIFLWGDRGTYKEMLARAIHTASPRKAGPFVPVDVAAREQAGFAAEFFGQARDWSGQRVESPGLLEKAAGGTLFLDEVDLLSMPVQLRLRGLLQTGEFYRENSTATLKADVRFIVASHHDLTEEYYADMFSRDLLYHLMQSSLHIPALRQRPGDVPLLAEYFLQEESRRAGKKLKGFSPDLMELLRRYDFPDNVRELRNIVAGAVANGVDEVLSLGCLPPHMREALTRARDGEGAGFRPRRLAEVEREHVLRTVAHFANDKARAAQALGVTVPELDSFLAG